MTKSPNRTVAVSDRAGAAPFLRTVSNFLRRLLPQRLKSVTSEAWSPFWGQGENGTFIQLGPLEDGFQRNLTVSKTDAERFAPVYACVSILSQELSRIPVQHFRNLDNGRRELVTNKAPYRIFRRPNKYQTKSDFMMYMQRSLLLDGNCYAVAVRNDRYEVEALYPLDPRSTWPYVVDGEIFYRNGDFTVSEIAGLDQDQWFPARDVMHLRMFTPNHPLIGESPIRAALSSVASGVLINAHSASFFANMSRPSGILRHPGTLDDSSMQRIKDRFMEITQRHHSGEPIVLQENMDWKPLTMSAVDAELINSFKLSERQIAQVFRIPPFLLGDLEKSTLNNVESLSRFFVQSALGFYIDHFENAFVDFFRLPPDEVIVFDVETALLRSDLESRMGAYSKGLQSGVFAPNEIRARENLPPVEHGDDPRVQQQLVPLSYGVNLPPKTNQQDVNPTEAEQLAASLIARKAIEKAMQQ